jgi:hypothetical protein
VLAGSNSASNFALIPPFGARSAVSASLLAVLTNFAAQAIFYRPSYPL